MDGAQTDKNEDRQFSFAEELPEWKEYDTIYFLSPIWWYTMPQPVRSFFQQVEDMEIFAQYSLSAMIDNEAAQKDFTEYLDTQDWLK